MDGTVYERFEVVGQQHSARLLPMIEEVLAEAGLGLAQCDGLAFGRGPGSFTGLRIGAGIAQGLAFGVALPVVPISSLAALAQGQKAVRVLAAFDARMGHLYWGRYVCNAGGLMEPAGAERVCLPAHVVVPSEGNWLGAGSGWDRYADQLLAVLDGAVSEWRPDQFPHARDVARLGVCLLEQGKAVSAEAAVPVYLRNNVAKKRTEREKKSG